MNHWPFIVAAYAIAIVGTVGITIWSFVVMRRAEARADAVTGRR
jgi:hypothetical protein